MIKLCKVKLRGLISKGLTAQQIADKLIISTPSVKKYAKMFGLFDALQENKEKNEGPYIRKSKTKKTHAPTRTVYKISGKTFATVKDISEQYGISYCRATTWVRNKLTDCGTMVRTLKDER
ncbi:MAG: hypothetical protein ACTSXG_03440 [Alphaproteobacteria bacterium]